MIVEIGPSRSFAEGTKQVLDVDDKEIGVIRWEGKLYAVRNICPHEMGPVCNGALVPRLLGPEVGVLETDVACGVLVCPWHRWEYDLKTGRALRDGRYRLKTYRIWEEDSTVRVETGGRDLAQAPRRAEG